ncbi:MAG TPA: acyloxyacyl hydrolase [Bacteroidales bacterium]|nr:acyloxyacyl hydrolase [Bacteroidales bacterium]
MPTASFTTGPRPAKVCCLLFLVILCRYQVMAQGEHKLFNQNLYIESKAYYGFLYAHHLELERYNAHFPAFELNVQQLTFGKHEWERAFNYPIIGVGLWYSSLGGSDEIGRAFALMPYINFPLFKENNFSFNFRFAIGPGYLTNRFNRISNFKNLAIGSHLNAAVNMMFEARYRVNTYFSTSAGICLQHFSNGSLKMPNYGLNAPMLSLGLSFKPARENRFISDRFYPPVEPYSAILTHSIEFDVGVSAGYKNMKEVLGKNYYVFHVYENTFYRVSRKSKWGIGLDASYDPSHIDILKKKGTIVENNTEIIRPGINAAYQLVLSRVGFIFNIGAYLGGAERSNGPLYEKISVQYQFSDDFFANVMLKVHFGRADYIGWGIGYKFDWTFDKGKAHKP